MKSSRWEATTEVTMLYYTSLDDAACSCDSEEHVDEYQKSKAVLIYARPILSMREAKDPLQGNVRPINVREPQRR